MLLLGLNRVSAFINIVFIAHIVFRNKTQPSASYRPASFATCPSQSAWRVKRSGFISENFQSWGRSESKAILVCRFSFYKAVVFRCPHALNAVVKGIGWWTAVLLTGVPWSRHLSVCPYICLPVCCSTRCFLVLVSLAPRLLVLPSHPDSRCLLHRGPG